MARTKTISVEALTPLGAAALAGVLVEHAEADPVLRKKLRMLLAATEGTGKLSKEIEKRIRTIGRSRSFVDWDRRKALVQELDYLRTMIAGTLAEHDRKAAAELMWAFIGIADNVLERVDDGIGYVEEVFGQALVDLGHICASQPMADTGGLARRVLAICEGDGFGSSGALIQHLSDALGPDGRAELRKATEASLGSLDNTGVSDSDAWRLDGRRRRLAHRLAILSDLDGDVDRYIKAMQTGNMEASYADDIAERLLAADRPAEALEWLKKSRRRIDEDDTAHIDLKVTALEALGEANKAQEARWHYFQKTLVADYLREHLRRLPDFEDFEREQEALDFAATHRSAETALSFFVEWSSLERADQLTRGRLRDFDGAAYYILRPAAEALEEKYPVAATLLYRRMVESVLDRGTSKQYPYAAGDLHSCARLAPRIAADGDIEPHPTFVTHLKKTHGRKYGFWGLVENEAEQL